MATPSFFYFLVKYFLRGFFFLYNRVDVFGRDQIPLSGPLIVASNHSSNLDPPLVGAFFPMQLRYLAKDSLFKNIILKKIIQALGAISVSREDSQKAASVLKLLLSRLQDGENVLLFPEGTRSQDGKLQKLEGGVAFLSVKAMVPIVPVYVGGSSIACPRGKMPIPSKLRLHGGKPIYPQTIVEEVGERGAREEILKQLTASLLHLEGEEERMVSPKNG